MSQLEVKKYKSIKLILFFPYKISKSKGGREKGKTQNKVIFSV
jgi:hypothetical protein